MKFDFLEAVNGPQLHTLVQTTGPAWDAVRLLEKHGLLVRLVRGRKMGSVAGLFDEFSAALQFPPYFGENWDALDECLADFRTQSKAGVVILISDASHILDKADADALAAFKSIMHKGAAAGRGGLGTPIHWVLQAELKDEKALQAKWQGVPAFGPSI